MSSQQKVRMAERETDRLELVLVALLADAIDLHGVN